MSGSGAQDKAAVHVDRLVFEIPGLDPARAEPLARDIGERLARTGLSGEHANIGITLGPVGSQAGLAARIVAALMERLA